MFTYCAPCPGNMNTTGGFTISVCAEKIFFASRASSVVAASFASRQTNIRRCENPARPTCNVNAASARFVSGCDLKCAARFAVAASSDACDFAESKINCAARDGPDGSTAGASSSTTCAFVPPTPNELTPARNGVAPGFQSVNLLTTWNGLASSSSFGFGFVKCSDGGSFLCFNASAVLMRPVTPAATSRWPKLLLTVPRPQKFFFAVFARNACVNAATSIGSPSGVPVPCASTYEIVSGSTPASACASAMTSACPSTLGAVKLTLFEPSLLSAAPLMTAEISSPSASASASRFNTTTPTPWLNTVPAAFTLNARQCPSGDVMPPS